MKSEGFKQNTSSCSSDLCAERREGTQLFSEQKEASLHVTSQFQPYCTDPPAKKSQEKKKQMN